MRTRLYLNRWLSFMASCLMQLSGGLSYSFSIYAPALKELWGLRETQIAALGSCFNFGGYLAIPSGALYDRMERHKRFGPRFVACIGVLVLCAGYLGLYAAAAGLVAPSFAFVCVCAFLGGNSSTWFDTAAIVTNVRNFPHDRGTVVGILKAFVGLSASVYSSVYAAAFAPDAVGYLRFLATGPPLLVLALLAVINLVPAAYHEPQPEHEQQAGKEGAAGKAGEREGGHGSVRPSEDGQGPPSSEGEHTDGGEEGAEAEGRRRQRRQRRHRRVRHSHGGGGGGDAHNDVEQATTPLLAAVSPPVAAAAAGHAAAPNAPRFSAAARFTFAFSLVGVIAVYQTAAALWAGAANPGPGARRALLGGLLGLLAFILALPVASGDWVHRKPRPEVVERVRRSLLGRIKDGGRAALRTSAAPFRRCSREVQREPGGVSAAPLGGVGMPAPGGEEVRPAVVPAAVAPAMVTAEREESGASAGPAAVPGVGNGAGSVNGANGGGGASGMPHHVVDGALPPAHGDGDGPGAPVPAHHVVGDAEVEAQLEALAEVPALHDLPLSAAARSPMFWLLLLQFSVGLGTGLSVLNNLGSIVVALGGQPGGQVVFVSLFSVANATGRLLGGVMSEWLLRRHGIPRTLCLLAASCLTLLGVGGAMASELTDLYATCLVAGLAFGAHWGLIPAITSDLFGLTHFGSNYTGLQLGPAVAGYLLSTVLTGKLYDRAARRHGDHLFCRGADCYLETWCVLGGLNLVALLGTRELYAMSAPRYRRLVRRGGV